MTPLSEEIFKNHQVRRTKVQKEKFAQLLKSRFDVKQEKHFSSYNLVIGDLNKAKVIFSAHYDTPLRMHFRPLSTPQHTILGGGYISLFVIPFLLIMLCVELFLCLIINNSILRFLSAAVWIFACLFVAVFIWRGLKPNPHNANDNTSGVITLCELIESLSEDEKTAVAFVFFDNEEKILKGSSGFRKKHKHDNLDDKLLINFDCVADGDHMVFAFNEKSYFTYLEKFYVSFPSTSSISAHMESKEDIHFASDQKKFPNGVGVSALHKKKIIGYYLTRIHTPKDVKYQFGNITYLVEGVKRLLKELP